MHGLLTSLFCSSRIRWKIQVDLFMRGENVSESVRVNQRKARKCATYRAGKNEQQILPAHCIQYCGSSGTTRGMKMISCRTQYKSYSEKNTHIHTPNTCFTVRFWSAPLVRTRGAYGSIHRGARLKGERVLSGPIFTSVGYMIFSSVQWGYFN